MKPVKLNHELRSGWGKRLDSENPTLVKVATAAWNQLGLFWNLRADLREPFYEPVYVEAFIEGTSR